MLKKIANKLVNRRGSELKVTFGGNIRNLMIKSRTKIIEESIYSVGNNTDNVIQLTEKAGGVIARATELVSGGESVAALSKIAFKITKDVIRSDDVCAELCLISGACQTVALCCSTIKVIPF